MQYLYLLCLIISVGMIIWLKIFDVRNSSIQLINLLIVMVANTGFYFVTISTNCFEAILAQKIALSGGVFLPVFYFFLVLEICHINLNRFISIILVMVQSAIYAIICNMEQNNLFYSNISTHSVNGICILDVECGTLHFVFPMMMFIYFLASFITAHRALRKNKSVNKKSLFIMLIFVTVALGAYVVERIINSGYEIIPVVYVVLMIGSLIPVYDSNLYTVNENKRLIDIQLSKVGFLTVNKNCIYKGCNEYMENIFPELKSYKIEQRFKNCSNELNNIINIVSSMKSLYENKHTNDLIKEHVNAFLLNDRYYVGKIYGVNNVFGKLKGYTVELWDGTEYFKAKALIENYNEELSREVEEKTRRIKDIQEKVVLGMAEIVESRDLSTGGHIKRTSDVVKIFAEKLKGEDMGFSSSFLDNVIQSAPMHDLGKLGIDDSILRKKTGLTDEDFAAMKKHPEIGYNMVGKVLADVEEPEFIKVAENVAHYHHEKMDGTGYPCGLKGDEIPVEARIMALADVYDALVSKRCYKEPLTSDEAFEIIKKGVGTQFDEGLTKIFFSCKTELEKYYRPLNA